MHHQHNLLFVILSVLVAVAGSWTALDLFRRLRVLVGSARLTWLATAAVAMGASIWSMHFIAMLGFDPGSPVNYDPGLTGLSLVLAMSATFFAFWLGSGARSLSRVLAAGAAMGLGICAMHYVGMAALRTAVPLGYDPPIVALSLAIAAAASTAALLIARSGASPAMRALAAVALGGAIAGMHYTAMAALRLGHVGAMAAPPGAPPVILAVAVALACTSILVIALLASLHDQRLNVLAALEAGRVGYWELFAPQMHLRLSATARQMLDADPFAPFTYQDLLQALSEACRSRLSGAVSAALETGQAFDLECALRGGDRWIGIRAMAADRRGTGWRRITGVVLDATELVKRRIEAEESEARLGLATDAARLGVWEWRLDTNEMIYSERAKAICGFAPDQLVTYEMARDVAHPDDFPVIAAQAERALDPAVREHAPYEYRIVTSAGELKWVYAQGEAVFETEDGRERATRYVGVIQDITDRRRAAQDLQASESRLRLAIEAGQMAVWEASADGEVMTNPALLRALGFADGARPTTQELRAGYPSGERDRILTTAGEALARGERFFEVEFQYRRPDGDLSWFLIRSEIRFAAPGEPTGAIGVLMNVTDRKRALERAQLLAREVDHRANNLLAVVHGVVALSRGEDVGELKEAIVGRVQALGKAHALLSESRWRGADLHQLAREEALAFDPGHGGRIAILGEPVSLSPAEAQALAMVLHELTTNAAKYGALSREGGRVRIAWRLAEDGELALTWEESGGPPVATPSRRGFGLQMLERAVSGVPGACVQLHWCAEGLVCEVALRRVDDGSEPKAADPARLTAR